MADIKVYERQSMLDIAVQYSGGIETVFDLALINELSITDDLSPCVSILGSGSIFDSDIVNYYSNKGIVPSTAPTTSEISQLSEDGIEFWAVEDDLIVS